MNKAVTFISLILVLSISCYSSDFQALDIKDRPESLQKTIDFTFNELSKQQIGGWRYNGKSSYVFLNIDPAEHVVSLSRKNPQQKEFFLLELGAGNFSWGKATADYINRQKDMPSGVKFHIIGVTGENYDEPQVIEKGKCKIYQIGSFKLENLKESFKKLNIDLDKKVDIITSDFTFIHLHDPVGTFIQAYDLLKPKGLVMMQGFPVLYKGEEDYYYPARISDRLFQFLNLTKAPFLVGDTQPRIMTQFILQRPDDKPLMIPLSYSGTTYLELAHTCAHEVVEFKKLIKFDKESIINKNFDYSLDGGSGFSSQVVAGDATLFEEIYQTSPYWQTISVKRYPLLQNDSNQNVLEHTPDSLFAAAKGGDFKVLKEKLIDEKVDINKRDPLGKHLLHFVHYNGKKSGEMLKFLLGFEGIDIDAQDDIGYTALSHAASDFGDKYNDIELLLKHKANPNLQNHRGDTALHEAINYSGKKNAKIISLLLENGADPTIKNKNGQTPFDLKNAISNENIKKVIDEWKEKHKK